jgi:serine/threonine-protein kinase
MIIECSRCGREVAVGDDCCFGCGFDPVNDPGRFGPFELLGRLGRGGVSVVFRARRNGSVVALKVLESTKKRRIEQFEREAAIMSDLTHPNVVKVFESGQADGHRYFSMELVEGISLSAAIRQRLLEPTEVALILAKSARAIDLLHQMGYIHRDLSPQNILLTAEREPKIVDFGLALRRESIRALAVGTTGGTPVYMSPEQAAGQHEQVDHRADVYGLGAVLFEAVAGRPPFTGPNTLEILRKVSEEPVEIPPDVETGLADIVRRALEKDPARRFSSMAEFAEALEGWERKFR